MSVGSVMRVTIDLSDSRESLLGAVRAVVDTGLPVRVTDDGIPTGTMIVPVGTALVGDATGLLDTVGHEREAASLLARDLNDVLTGGDVAPRDRGMRLAVAVAELRELHEAFDARPDEMTEAFYINAFSQYDTMIHELLDALAVGDA